PGGRHQRRLPVPARPRGRGPGRGGGRRRDRGGAGRLRGPQLAGGGRGRAGVAAVARGDFVFLTWRAVCGQCGACRRGRPHLCFATHNATQKMTLTDGTTLSPALGIGAFAEKTLVAAGQCTPVDAAAKPEVAGLLGCGVMAGIGAALPTGGGGPGADVAAV